LIIRRADYITDRLKAFLESDWETRLKTSFIEVTVSSWAKIIKFEVGTNILSFAEEARYPNFAGHWF